MLTQTFMPIKPKGQEIWGVYMPEETYLKFEDTNTNIWHVQTSQILQRHDQFFEQLR